MKTRLLALAAPAAAALALAGTAAAAGHASRPADVYSDVGNPLQASGNGLRAHRLHAHGSTWSRLGY
jgi:ABC-type sugar transport system substrate-binding protein